MSFIYLRPAAIALALLTAAGCTVKSTQPPPLSGPSGLALTLRVNALPDAINQDGGSQSSVKVTAIGPDGKGIASLPLRLDMAVNGVAQDYGSLNRRSVVTDGDGVATAVYTAPPSPVNGVFGTCAGVPGNCVSIVATATSTDFLTANPEQATIRLVPTGVIQPPASNPTASFQFSPATVGPNQTVTFDGTASCGGTVSGGTCGSASQLTYSWNFGDGTSGAGPVTTHSYANVASFTVTLTVTNDRGVSASTTKVVTVTASDVPNVALVYSPTIIHVNDKVFFNASGSTAGSGRTIRSYDWDFGDGTPHGSTVAPVHVYAKADTGYTVTLIVTDDLGQQGVNNSTKVAVVP
jgi:PKD repeat protein